MDFLFSHIPIGQFHMIVEVLMKCLENFDSFHDLTKFILATLDRLFKV